MSDSKLKSRKVYKATTFKAWHRSLQDAEPVSAADLKASESENAELLDLAEPAIEIDQNNPVNVLNELPEFDITAVCTETLTSAGVKAPKESLKRRLELALVQPVKLSSLRHSAIKAARRPLATQTSALAQVFQTNNDLPKELVDGARIQIRQSRRPLSKAATKIVEKPLEVESTTTQDAKPTKARRLKRKTTKSAKSTSKLSKKKAKQSKKSTKVAAKATSLVRQVRRRPSRADLINAESRLGSMIFGPVPEGHRREFFHDRDNIWIWHEGWVDPATKHSRQLTVRYEVRPAGVFKKVSAGHYIQLKGAELENFRRATHVYLQIIKQKLYRYA